MGSLLVVHFLPTWIVGAIGVRLLWRRPMPRALWAGLCFAPVVVTGGWFDVLVPIPSFVGDGLLQGAAPAALARQALPPLAIGTAAAALIFGLIGRWRQAPRVPSGSHGR